MQIPFLDLAQQHKSLHDEILEHWSKILLAASFIGGDYIDRFEQDFASVCDVDHCVSVASGTDALRFIFLALGVKAGDEVIVPVNTFIATSEAVSQAGGVPVFVDIDPQTYNLDPTKLAAAITVKTKGIVAVHLYGQPADMATINDVAQGYGLWVVEDACQAHLAKFQDKMVGGLSLAAAFSFYPGKNLGACGEAGAVTTVDPVLANKIRKLRNHGQGQKYIHELEGYNGRCDALQAAALQVKLPYLSAWSALRRKHAKQYNDELSAVDLQVPIIRPDVEPVYHLYVVLVTNRDKVGQYLNKHGIATGLHYPVPLHLQQAYKNYPYNKGDFPVAERCADMLLSLPLYPELTAAQISYVATKLKEAIEIYG